MIYESLQNLIKGVAEASPFGVRYRHGRVSDINEDLKGQRTTTPLIWMFPAKKTAKFINKGNRLLQTYNVKIAVYKPDQKDSTPEQQLAIINETDQIITQFLIDFNNTIPNLGDIYDDIELTNVTAEPFFRETSFICTGHLVGFNITLPDNFDYCG